jgi:hypothetical protein
MIAAYGQSFLPLLSGRDEKSVRGVRAWFSLRMWIEEPGGG